MGFKDDERHNDPPVDFSRKNPYDLNSKIMLTAIVSLSFVVILVITLHIYARCVLRRQARRRRAAIRSFDLANHVQSTEPPKTGLDPIVIASLPIFVFKQRDGQDCDDEEEVATIECAVCLSNLENEETARLLPNCKHTFHAECIDKWLGSHSTCPICRTEAEPRLQPEPREGPATVAPTAPPLVRVNSTLVCAEGTSNCSGVESSAKVTSSSSSRLSSFRRILSRERSSRRLQSCGQEDEIVDLERQ
ncbi:RING-H2 finger protein [Melia azedarach]|uniref:RING-H2 finger protein n=2 Tax=Melia azedarach TaxID=155640 RepID=A0ACC1Z146_MELAZ|nr:RING-H2 finger protein [Melia azedarach]KAJ4729696.1 RING-H2 finger protein [Melia azedarach]